MTDETKYTADQFLAVADIVEGGDTRHPGMVAAMLRQAAKAQREREVGGAVTDADVEAARQAANTTGCVAWDGRLRKEAARAATSRNRWH